MKWLCTVLLVLMCDILFAQKNINSTTNVYNEEGQLQMAIAYSPSCNCRTYTEFYTDGKIFAKRSFQLMEKGEFVHGEDVSYYHDGTIKTFKFWNHAVPDGKAFTNYEDGKPEHEEYYANKYKTGTWKYYDKDGKLLREKIYVPGRTLWDNKKEDVTVRYYKAGVLTYNETFIAGKKTAATGKAPETIIKKLEETDGKKLFQLRCAACHAPDKEGYGPALAEVTKKRDELWLFKMVNNGMKLVEQNDPIAFGLYNTWGKKKHPSQEGWLDKKQVTAIIDHLKTMKK